MVDLIPHVSPGDRIRLLSMGDDPQPIAPGALGTVNKVECFGVRTQNECWIITVRWDNGRGLNLVYPQDTFERVGPLDADTP